MRQSKYSQLNDRNWLHQRYEIEKVSLSKMGLEIGCDRNSVKQALFRYEIPLRKKTIPKLFKELNDRQWLYARYAVQKLSLKEIAAQLGIPEQCSRIRYALMKNGIRVRKKGEGQRIWHRHQGTEDHFIFNKSVIAGCLLGDGGFKIQNPRSNDSCPAFCKGNINFDHVLYVANLLFSKNGDNRIFKTENGAGFDNGSAMFRFSTLTHPCLMDWYRSWYPDWNDYKKVIPSNLELDQTALLHWFMDDGYSYWASHKNGKRKYLRVEFATQCFNKFELELLADSILNVLNIRMAVRFHQRHGKICGTGCEMHVQQKDVPAFFEVIGPCPVPSLAYKWKIPS